MNIKLKTLITVSFSFLSFLLIIGTSIGFYAALITKQRLETNHTQYVGIEEPVNQLLHASAIIDVHLQQANHTGEVNLQAITAERGDIDAAISDLDGSQTPAELSENLAELQAAWGTFKERLSLVRSGQEVTSEQVAALHSELGAFTTALQAFQTANHALTESIQETTGQDFNSIETFVVLAGSAGVVITIIVGIYLTGQIFKPLNTLGGRLHQISLGQLAKSNADFELLIRRENEVGALARDLLSVEDYFQSISQIAAEMSHGNLAVEAAPRSSEDELGFALQRMTHQLSALISQATEFSQRVNQASSDLSQSAHQTDRDNSEITVSISQINEGIGHENKMVNEALRQVEKTNLVVEQLGSHAGQQQQAADEASAVTNQINSAIDQVMVNAGNVAASSEQSTKTAQDGTLMLNQTIDSINAIQRQVKFFAEKVNVMGQRSHEINRIVDSIEQIASTTNILAINATIEAAHAKIQSERLTEDLLNQMMMSECHMIQHMLEQGAESNPIQFWKDLCSTTSLDTILMTDDDGVVTLANEENLLNWRFPDDPHAQTFPFRQLIHQKEGVCCQDAQARSLDGQVFKYVGISRKSQPGIIQVGFKMSTLKAFDLHINGFAVVAEEVYHLAERAHEASKEIRKLVTSIQESTDDAIDSVQKSSDYVLTSINKAEQARQTMQMILASIDQVLGHTASTLQATRNMQGYTRRLSGSMEIVNQTVHNNQKAAAQMGEGFAFIRQTFKQVASLGEQNTIATVQVNASTQGMKTQIKNVVESSTALAGLSRNLQAIIGKFTVA